ncbi:MAG: type II toxin-antitoxin system VapC family toxin [Thermoprotei archaeon]|nr:MAG: type II toxin-antitoxin system VapC family toxin [Thermoprotei archaeon]
MYLFDTDYVINLVRGDRGAINLAKKIEKEMIYRAISIVTVHEYLLGVYFSHWRNEKKLEKMLEKAESELMRFDIIPYDYKIAKKTAEIMAYLRREGRIIGLADVIIAATALVNQLKLVTRNTKHFSQIPNLKITTY